MDHLFGWWRETAYGRTSQPLGDFLGQAALSAAITALIAAVFMTRTSIG